MPDERGRGVGRALLETAIAWAREVGAHALVLDVTIGNSSAARLYEGAGFLPTGIENPLRPGSELRSRGMHLSLASDVTESSA